MKSWLPWLLAASTLAADAFAAQVTQFPPNDLSNTAFVRLWEQYTNNDTNTLYNSASVRNVTNLLNRIWQLPHNKAAYTSVLDMIQSQDFSVNSNGLDRVRFFISTPYAIYVDAGWGSVWQTNATVSIVHGPFYVKWDQSMANQRTREVRFVISKSLLDANGDGWSREDPQDFQIVLTDHVVAGAFRAWGPSGYTEGISDALA